MDELTLYEIAFSRLLELAGGDIEKIPKPVLLEAPVIDSDFELEDYDPYEFLSLKIEIALSVRNEKMVRGTEW